MSEFTDRLYRDWLALQRRDDVRDPELERQLWLRDALLLRPPGQLRAPAGSLAGQKIGARID